MDEIWKDIKGFEGLYQGSNEGQVRSIDRMDSIGRYIKGKILKPATGTDGYHYVQLCKDGKAKTFQVHRLIYAAFCGEIPSGMQVNHINECKTDNRLSNLNLMTPKDNTNWGTGIERGHKAQLNDPRRSKQVIGYDENGDVVITFPSTRDAQRHGYNSGNISSCCRGEAKHHKGLRWKYADGDC